MDLPVLRASPCWHTNGLACMDNMLVYMASANRSAGKPVLSRDTQRDRQTEWNTHSLTHSLTAALDQLRVVASSTSNDPGPRSRQHQQIGQCLLPLVAANFSVGASSQQREECRCGLLLTVAVPAKQVCCPVGDRCDQIMNDVCQQ